ncbi:MAG TPA: hypothetical protein VKB38_04280 [Terracidiphilus sp.]|nr:hypothetical protein [Terracidiphilus sp.]
MATLLDTNILIRLMQPHSAQAGVALRALEALRLAGENLNIDSQNLFEFWVVATRPAGENGLGLTIEQAAAELL